MSELHQHFSAYFDEEGCKPKLYKVKTNVLVELLYADGMDKKANSEAKCKRQWIKFHSHVITIYM